MKRFIIIFCLLLSGCTITTTQPPQIVEKVIYVNNTIVVDKVVNNTGIITQLEQENEQLKEQNDNLTAIQRMYRDYIIKTIAKVENKYYLSMVFPMKTYPTENKENVIILNREGFDYYYSVIEGKTIEYSMCFNKKSTNKITYYDYNKYTLRSGTETTVPFDCDSDLILHNHPNGYCGFSEKDLTFLKNNEKVNYLGVVCDINKLQIINRDMDTQDIIVVG